MINCHANDNYMYGYWGVGSNYQYQMVGCTASGNGIKDYK
jgi:hypothetical protein